MLDKLLEMLSKPKKEFKSLATEFKVHLEINEFEGYASTFGNRDAGGDIVDKGAFKKTIKEFMSRMKVLWQHDPSLPIGKPLKLKEDSHGLYFHAKVSETRQGNDALILMKDGVITEMSIGYDAKKYNIDEETETRHLTEVKLWEFSPVTWGMNDLALITDAKSNGNVIIDALFQLNDFIIKEGRVLSKQNRKLIDDAISALQALLELTEPGKTTPRSKESPNGNDEPIEESLIEVSEMLKSIDEDIETDQFVSDLQDFGRRI